MQPTPWGLGSLILLILLLAGCKNPADDMIVHKNPHPQHGYRVIFDTTRAPGLPVKTTASVSFEVPPAEELCMVRSQGLAEYRIPWQTVDIPLKEAAPGIFEGVMYLDWFSDENYFGQGTCRWRMNTVNAGFVGTGGMGFGVGLGYTTLAPGAKSTAYYYVDEFAKDSATAVIPIGTSVPTNFYKDNPDYVADTAKFFPIYLTVEALNPQGLTPEQELEQRIQKAGSGQAEPQPKAP